MRYLYTRIIPQYRAFLFLLLSLLLSSSLSAQLVRIDNPTDSVAFCSGFFVDQGVFNGPHSAEGADTVTICSNSTNSDQTHIRLAFTQLEIAGQLDFYNGPNTDAPLLETFTSADNGIDLFVQANAANPSGCLTIVFTPDGSTPGDGWRADISCQRVCQPVIANLGSTIPEISPADTGYIDVCFGEPVVLNAATLYPLNGTVYDQSDATSTLNWTMDDGTRLEGTSVTHVYDQPGGYTVQLFVTDINDCMSTNFISQRIRVAPIPEFQLQNATPVVCTDEPFTLSGSTVFDPDPNSNLFVFTEEQSFSAGQTLADTTFLPDGDNNEYNTSLDFNNFEPGQTLEDINDLEGICLNMEHSYIGDLDVFIVCPNGQEAHMVVFASFDNLTGQFLGEPIDIDADLTPGVGFDYCFTPQATLTWDQAVEDLGIGFEDSLPPGDYASDEPLTSLLGCPLNGEWTIRVRDNLLSDNGYIFSWGISFNPELFVDLERYNVTFDSTFWSDNPDFVSVSGDEVEVAVPGAGPQAYTYNVIDEFGCQYDTTVIVDVLPVSHPECYECPPLLAETSVSFMGEPGQDVTIGLEEADSSIPVPWQVSPMAAFSNNIYPSSMVPFESAVAVTTIVPTVITDATTDIISVCVEIETPATGDINLSLRAPNGTLMPLSVNNGGFGSNFSGTCFSPSAATAIGDGAAPFSGEFQPDGDWSMLNGSMMNGIWSIVAWDEGLDEEVGMFISWNITFRYQDELTYTWSPSDGLSCTNCPNPTIALGEDEDLTYELTISNDRNCSESGTVTVTSGITLVADIMGTNPSCSDVDDGTLSVTVSGGMEPYMISWDPPADGFELMGLGAGAYSATVTDAAGDSLVLSLDLTAPEPLVINADVVDVLCADDSTGSIDLTVSGGTGAYSYDWGEAGQGEDLLGLPAGDYTVVVTDENNCTATATYTIEEPDPLVVMADVMDVTCAGDSSGAIILMVTGGSGSYTYLWSDGSMDDDRLGVPAGAYTVTVTDENGCETTSFGAQMEPELVIEDPFQNSTVLIDGVILPDLTIERSFRIVDTIFVNEPPAIEVEVTKVDVQCVGDSTGSISLQISGGVDPYFVMWNTEATGPELMGLEAGTYSATVTDANGCTYETGDIEILGLTDIAIEITATDPLCAGEASGMIIPVVSGGTESYIYDWSNESNEPSLTAVPAGEYGLTVMDANGCGASISGIVLVDPPVLSCEVSVDQEPTTGDNGALTVTATGGTGEYTYLWSNDSTTASITGLSDGIYSVTVTDENGCTTVCSAELLPFATVGDYVWDDRNRDGIQDPDEPGLPNRFVSLTHTTDESLNQSTVTDADGRYIFHTIAGDYTLTFVAPAGYSASPRDAAGDDTIDSDIDPDTRTTDVITLAPGDENLDVDAGFFDPCFPPINNPGVIGFDGSVCGPGNVPDMIVELLPASGGVGELNYLWMFRLEGGGWQPIPGTDSKDYQPGPLFESTFFTRCVRRDECVYFESNVVFIEVGDDATADIVAPSLICEGEVVTFIAEGLGPNASISWDFGIGASVPTSSDPVVEVSFNSFGSFEVSLTVADNGCTAVNMHEINVTNNPAICGGNRLGAELLPGAGLQTEVYPNPNDGQSVWLELRGATELAEDLQLQFFDARGRLVAQRRILATNGQLQLDDLTNEPNGVYLLRVAAGDEVQTHRLIVRR
ncbi:MAG: SdrD B-like domain-containing protein [Bacteroidota bacterium]